MDADIHYLPKTAYSYWLVNECSHPKILLSGVGGDQSSAKSEWMLDLNTSSRKIYNSTWMLVFLLEFAIPTLQNVSMLCPARFCCSQVAINSTLVIKLLFFSCQIPKDDSVSISVSQCLAYTCAPWTYRNLFSVKRHCCPSDKLFPLSHSVALNHPMLCVSLYTLKSENISFFGNKETKITGDKTKNASSLQPILVKSCWTCVLGFGLAAVLMCGATRKFGFLEQQRNVVLSSSPLLIFIVSGLSFMAVS